MADSGRAGGKGLSLLRIAGLKSKAGQAKQRVVTRREAQGKTSERGGDDDAATGTLGPPVRQNSFTRMRSASSSLGSRIKNLWGGRNSQGIRCAPIAECTLHPQLVSCRMLQPYLLGSAAAHPPLTQRLRARAGTGLARTSLRSRPSLMSSPRRPRPLDRLPFPS